MSIQINQNVDWFLNTTSDWIEAVNITYKQFSENILDIIDNISQNPDLQYVVKEWPQITVDFYSKFVYRLKDDIQYEIDSASEFIQSSDFQETVSKWPQVTLDFYSHLASQIWDEVEESVYYNLICLLMDEDFQNSLSNWPQVSSDFYTEKLDSVSKLTKETFDTFINMLGNVLENVSVADQFENRRIIEKIQSIGEIKQLAEAAVEYYDPLVVDIGKNGFELTSVRDGVNFDLDNNGIAEKTGWVKGDDAFLALDRNGNGIVDNGGELFGDRTVLHNGEYASSGFEALAEYDNNMDGFIDSNDEVYDSLMLWNDANQDGISSADELHSLDDFGISAINLNYMESGLKDDDSDSLLANISSVVFNDGTETSVGEFKFAGDKIDSSDKMFSIAEDIKKLPNVRAIGYVHSLHYAMTLDNTGELKSLVENFVQSNDVSERESLINDILFFLCDASEIDPSSRGGFIDARKLAVLEKFLAEPFEGVEGSNPNSQAAILLEESYSELCNSYYIDMAGYNLKKYYTAAYATTSKNEDGSPKLNIPLFNALVKSDLSKGALKLHQLADLGKYVISKDSEAFVSFAQYFTSLDRAYGDIIQEYCSSIKGSSDNDFLYAGNTGSAVAGLSGNDNLYGSVSSDLLFGGAGDDSIIAASGDDTLDGGNGNDYLEGGVGNDTYVFNIGDGIDRIYDYENSQTEGRADKIMLYREY